MGTNLKLIISRNFTIPLDWNNDEAYIFVNTPLVTVTVPTTAITTSVPRKVNSEKADFSTLNHDYFLRVKAKLKSSDFSFEALKDNVCVQRNERFNFCTIFTQILWFLYVYFFRQVLVDIFWCRECILSCKCIKWYQEPNWLKTRKRFSSSVARWKYFPLYWTKSLSKRP